MFSAMQSDDDDDVHEGEKTVFAEHLTQFSFKMMLLGFFIDIVCITIWPFL